MQESQCPTNDELRDFADGRLPEAEIESISVHCSNCATCEETIAGLSGEDTLVQQIHECGVDSGEVLWSRELCDEVISRVLKPHDEESHDLPEMSKFEIHRKLGAGGMGTVYEATHKRLDRKVALKVLAPGRTSPAALERFEKEMKAVGRLLHPNIIRADDADEDDGHHYLTMELVDGVDLSILSKAYGELDPGVACELIRQAALGLQHAHQSGIIHRDIKPSNLMLDRSGTVKLLDLGLARLQGPVAGADSETTASGQIMGTLDYMSPEQCSDSHDIDVRADIYSLGATLFKLLTGSVPYSDPSLRSVARKAKAILDEPAPSVREQRPDLDEELIKTVDQMMKHDRDDRPDDVASVIAMLIPHCKQLQPNRMFARIDEFASSRTASSSPLATTQASPARESNSSRQKTKSWPLIALATLTLAAAISLGVVLQWKVDGGMVVAVIDGKEVNVLMNDSNLVITDPTDHSKIRVTVDKKNQKLVFRKDGFDIVSKSFDLKTPSGRRVELEFVPDEKIVRVDEHNDGSTDTLGADNGPSDIENPVWESLDSATLVDSANSERVELLQKGNGISMKSSHEEIRLIPEDVTDFELQCTVSVEQQNGYFSFVLRGNERRALRIALWPDSKIEFFKNRKDWETLARSKFVLNGGVRELTIRAVGDKIDFSIDGVDCDSIVDPVGARGGVFLCGNNCTAQFSNLKIKVLRKKGYISPQHWDIEHPKGWVDIVEHPHLLRAVHNHSEVQFDGSKLTLSAEEKHAAHIELGTTASNYAVELTGTMTNSIDSGYPEMGIGSRGSGATRKGANTTRDSCYSLIRPDGSCEIRYHKETSKSLSFDNRPIVTSERNPNRSATEKVKVTFTRVGNMAFMDVNDERVLECRDNEESRQTGPPSLFVNSGTAEFYQMRMKILDSEGRVVTDPSVLEDKYGVDLSIGNTRIGNEETGTLASADPVTLKPQEPSFPNSKASISTVNPVASTLVCDPADIGGLQWWNVETFGPRFATSAEAIDRSQRFVAVGDAMGTVRVWETKSNTLVGLFPGFDSGAVNSLGFSGKGRYLACVRSSQRPLVYDVQERKIVFVANVPNADCAAFSADGKYMAVGCNESLVIVDCKLGAAIETFEVALGVKRISWLHNSTQLIVSAGSNRLECYDIDQGHKWSAPAHIFGTQSIDVSPNGFHIVSLGSMGDLAVRNTQNGKLVRHIKIESGSARQVIWETDRTLLILDDGAEYRLSVASKKLLGKTSSTASFLDKANGRVFRITTDTGSGDRDPESSLTVKPLTPNPEVLTADFSPSGASMALGRLGSLAIWKRSETDRLFVMHHNDESNVGKGFQSVSWSPVSEHVVLGHGPDATPRLFDIQTSKVRQIPFEQRRDQFALTIHPVWSPDGEFIYGRHYEQDAYIRIGLNPFKAVPPIPSSAGEAEGFVAVSSSPIQFYSLVTKATSDHSIQIINSKTFEVIDEIPLPQEGTWHTHDLDVSPDGRYVVRASGDSDVFDTIEKSHVRLETSPSYSCSFDPTNAYLAISVRANPKLFAVGTWKEIPLNSRGFTDFATPSPFGVQNKINWCAKTSLFVTPGTLSNDLAIWDAENAELHAIVRPYDDDQGLIVTPDGHWIGTERIQNQMRYVSLTDDGQFQVHTPEEFAAKYDFKNDPSRIRMLKPTE